MDWRKIALKVIYWAAVLAVSIAILVGLILLLESRDNSSIDSGSVRSAPAGLAAR
jgi:hypothetical protein